MKKKWILPAFLLLASLGFLAFSLQQKEADQSEADKVFEQFAIKKLMEEQKASGRNYLPFLNRSTLRCGIYSLPVGTEDKQQPHDLDEVYYVLSGKGKFTVEKEVSEIKEGDVLFVAAKADHHFHDIIEDLELLVFFSNDDPAK